MNARHRVSKMLLGQGGCIPSRRPGRRSIAGGWRPAVSGADVGADVGGPDRVRGRADRPQEDARRADRRVATDPAWWPTVARLRAFGAMDLLTALAVHLEIGDNWRRFEKANRVGSWLGLTPSRRQSGEHGYHGSITKTGSQLARRLLVEAAWHYGREPRVGATLANRQEGQPESPQSSPSVGPAANTACIASTRACERAASTTTSRSSRSPGSCRASSGPPRPHPDPAASPH